LILKVGKTGFYRTSGFLSVLISSPFNQRTRVAFPVGFGPVSIKNNLENRFFSDSRFFVGLDFIIIEISVVLNHY